MSDCTYAAKCNFYNKSIGSMPGNADELITEYCEGNSLRCARAMVYDALGDGKAPDDLVPDNKPKAYELIAEG